MGRVIGILIINFVAILLLLHQHSADAAYKIPSKNSLYSLSTPWEPPQPITENWKNSQSKINFSPRAQSDFSTRDSRLGFIRKVFAIFGTQMATTIGITYYIMTNPDISSFLLGHYQHISMASLIASTGIVFSLVSNPELRYSFPINIILLGLHTLLQSLIIGTISSLMSPKTVCLGTVHSLAVFAAIALYTFQPNRNFDFTVLGNTLLAAVTSLGVGSLLNLFFDMPIFDNILYGALAVLFAVYLFHDMSLIVGGKHRKYKYSQKEYILAALNLYQDMIGLYMHIINFLKEKEKMASKT